MSAAAANSLNANGRPLCFQPNTRHGRLLSELTELLDSITFLPFSVVSLSSIDSPFASVSSYWMVLVTNDPQTPATHNSKHAVLTYISHQLQVSCGSAPLPFYFQIQPLFVTAPSKGRGERGRELVETVML